MKHGLLLRSPCAHSLSRLSLLPFSVPLPATHHPGFSISAALDSAATQSQHLTARERRQMRSERRESKMGYSWREEVEERLIKKPKKRHASWTEELNLDNLAKLGPQWWVVRASRVRGQETSERLARSLARNFPGMEFKVYAPAVHTKRRLKNGSYSTKSRPLYPGCVFLRCVLNKELHDFIREIDGVGGFVGSRVGNTKRQINKPRPVEDADIEAIFKEAKEEQEKADHEFEEEQKAGTTPNFQNLLLPPSDAGNDKESVTESKPKRRLRKVSGATTEGSTATGEKKKRLTPGSSVRVVSGTFAEFVGNLKKLNRKTRKATVGFTLLGKETTVELDVDEIVPLTD